MVITDQNQSEISDANEQNLKILLGFLTEISSSMTSSEAKFSPWVAGALSINYIIGSGFLLLPWVFSQVGVVLALTIFALTAIFSFASVSFIVNSTYLAHELSDKLLPSISSGNLMDRIQPSSSSSASVGIGIGRRSEYGSIESGQPVSQDKCDINNQLAMVEMTDLCDFYLGNPGKVVYLLQLCLFLYGSLWAYAGVFAVTLSSIHSPVVYIPFLGVYRLSYYVCLLMFSSIAVPLSILNLSEQVSMQVVMTACRFLMFLLMISTVMHAALLDIEEFTDSPHSTQMTSLGSGFNYSKLYLVLPIAAYANIFHHAVPSLSDLLQDQKYILPTFAGTVFVCFAFYILVGIILSSYFGSNTQMTVNLNWSSYVGFSSQEETVPMYALIISKFVVLFPALDVISAFPLNAVALGNNLYSYFYHGSNLHRVTASEKYDVFVRRLFRLVAAIPPIIGAACVTDLSVITDYTGVTGFGVAFVVPALLMLSAERKCRERFGRTLSTPYSHVLTGSGMQYAVLAIGLFLIVYVLASLLAKDT